MSAALFNPLLSAPSRSPVHAALRNRALRSFYVASALAALVALLAWSVGGYAQALPLAARMPMMLACGVVALVAFSAVYLPAEQSDTALPVVAAGGALALGAVAAFSGWGLAMPGLVFLGLLACLAWALGGPLAGGLATGAGAAVLAGLGLAEGYALLPAWGTPTASGLAVWPRLLAHAGALALGSYGGLTLSRMLERHVATAGLRERRFQALLGIAAAAYWETDGALRLRRVSWRDGNGQFMPLDDAVGRMPWGVGPLQFAADTIDALRADMEGREPLRDLACTWQRSDGSKRHFLVDGEPRKDPQGRFLGYWGVAREVTREYRARAALQATERRYQELFVRLPTALVLHRHGQIVDANPAAAQLLGYASAARMVGHDLLAEHFEDDHRPAASASLAQLDQLAVGESLPAVPLTMRSSHGGAVQVRAVGARADSDGQPAMLSILIDETATLAAARAQQRTEELFAQVLSTSPDIITLTDSATGQYLMVNEAFCQATGYALDEVIGRSSTELGIWHRPQDRDMLLQLLAERGAARNLLVDFSTKNGQVLPLLVSASRFERDGRQRLVINARDVNDVARLKLEREAILANASVGIAFTRAQRFEMVNPQFERIYGWPAGTLTGQPTLVVWPSAQELAALGDEIGPALRLGDAVEIERQGVRHDGSDFLVRLRAKALDPLHPEEHGTIWIAEDVTRQRQDEQALARARDEAEAASRAKSTFLANTSHEIRTPLNGLLGLARLARQPNVPAQRLREYLEQIGESAETLSMVISDILDLSKIEAGRLEVDSAPFNLRELLHSLQQAYGALAAGHGLAFSVEVDRLLPARVRGDALRVRQILANFLHNALKFTPGGSIRLVVLCRPGEVVRFEVHDTGPGIDEATQARLFKPFSQGDDSTSRRFGGTGLGLSISHELATLMGGTVGVLSTPARGSCFYAELRLPDTGPSGDSPPDVVANEHLLRGARVLLAEDNAVNMMIASALLEQWGVVVTPVTDGTQALAAVAQAQASGQPLQAVLMDVQMPGMSGYEVTEQLRKQYSAEQLPVIALTAAALVSEREQAAAAGMNDFVTKPIDATRLRRALAKALAPSDTTDPARNLDTA